MEIPTNNKLTIPVWIRVSKSIAEIAELIAKIRHLLEPDEKRNFWRFIEYSIFENGAVISVMVSTTNIASLMTLLTDVSFKNTHVVYDSGYIEDGVRKLWPKIDENPPESEPE